MEVTAFAEMQADFIERVHTAVWCSMATLDTKNRPRSRVVHPVWEGQVGWIMTRRGSHKAKHLAHSPYVSLAYIADLAKPVYVDVTAAWADDMASKRHVWNLCLSLPAPAGFDPATLFKSLEDPTFGLLKLTPWRIELADFTSGPRVWHAPAAPPASPFMSTRLHLR